MCVCLVLFVSVSNDIIRRPSPPPFLHFRFLLFFILTSSLFWFLRVTNRREGGELDVVNSILLSCCTCSCVTHGVWVLNSPFISLPVHVFISCKWVKSVRIRGFEDWPPFPFLSQHILLVFPVSLFPLLLKELDQLM